MRGSEAVVRFMEDVGAGHLFGIPGGANLAIYQSLAGSRVRHHLTRTEQGAAHMADGYARVTGRAGFCIATSGPGATNLVTGLGTAYMDSIPVVAITGQVGTKALGTDAFQEADVFDVMIPVTKANYKVKRPEDLVPTLRKAYATAMSGRRGPVAVDIPSDISMSQVEYTAYRYEGAKFPEVPDVSEAVGALRSSQRPVILAGGGAKAEGCRELILELSRRIGAPVVTTVMGKGAVPEDYELALGITGIHGRGSSRYVLNRSDFVMALGARFSDRTTAKMDEFIPSRTVVHVVNDEAEIGKRKKDVIGIRADIVDFLREFLKYVGENERREAWVQEVRKVREFCRCDFNFMSEPMKPQKLIHAMNSVLPEDAILVADVGQHQMFAAHYFEARGTRKFITSGGMGTMGYALPAAIGAKIGRPDKPVVALIGDGGFMMTVSELATAVEEDVAVKAVVMNNASLGMIRQFQAHFYGNVIYAADYSKAPNFAKIAEGFGVQSSTVERPSEMEDALREMLAYRGPYVLEVRTDREEECLPMTPPWGGKADIIYGRCRWKEVENGEVAGFSQ